STRLVGGGGTSWRVRDVVLKPGIEPAFQEWLGTEVSQVDQHGFRLPVVLRAVDGQWVAEGWGAYSAVPGSAAQPPIGDWREVIAAARALHAATTGLGRPAFLASRSDPWAVADRAAWGEGACDVRPELREHVRRLNTALAPLGPSQLVHGDLTGNVLITASGPPSIIDFSPYWRPPSYAEGIVVADALCWHGATPDIITDLGVPTAAVARGLLFRMLTTVNDERHTEDRLRDEVRRYSSALDALNL
ncbi:MAG TPA: phosphotransferase, partial [Pedococcus sp.]|nr:phosphotransferase [Pedococcus sp.]